MNEKVKKEADKRLDALCAAMGQAIWEAQGLEQLVGKYYVVAFKLSNDAQLEEIENQFEKAFALTAGRLVGQLRGAGGADAETQARLDAFVEERNWLVHRLRRSDFQALLDAHRFEQLAARVASLESEARNLIEVFNDLMIQHFINIGVPKEHIEREMQNEYNRIFAS